VTQTARALGLPAALLALAGCVTVQVGKVEAALFPAVEAASAPRLAGRVALVLPPAVRQQTHPGPMVAEGARPFMQLPVGAVVDAALQRQLGAAFTGGALPAALPLAAGSDTAAAVVVVEARLAFDRHLNWFVPIPVPWFIFMAPLASSTNYSARLELDLRVSDALGRVLAQTTVDSGKVVVERGQWTAETELQRYQTLLHQAAWQAAAQAARVVRETLQAERQRERTL
jgi:hypothetical protein